MLRVGFLQPREGVVLFARPDPLPWGTPSYVPPEWDAGFEGQSRLPEDLYALGTIVHLLLAGRLPDASPPPGKLRRHVPPGALRVVAELLDPDARRRPADDGGGRRLTAALARMSVRP